jgi:hypothetical protein
LVLLNTKPLAKTDKFLNLVGTTRKINDYIIRIVFDSDDYDSIIMLGKPDLIWTESFKRKV